MSQNVEARIAGDLFGAVAPEDNFFLQIEHTDADLQAVENVAANVGIVKGQHVECARVLLVYSSAEKRATSEHGDGEGIAIPCGGRKKAVLQRLTWDGNLG